MFDLKQSNTSGKCLFSTLYRCFACAQGWQKLWGCQYLATVPPFPLIFAQHALAPPPALATYVRHIYADLSRWIFFFLHVQFLYFFLDLKETKRCTCGIVKIVRIVSSFRNCFCTNANIICIICIIICIICIYIYIHIIHMYVSYVYIYMYVLYVL